MKRKILLPLFVLTLIIPCAVLLTACGNSSAGSWKFWQSKNDVVAITWLTNAEMPYEIQFDNFDVSKYKIEVHFENGKKEIKTVQKDWVDVVFAYTTTSGGVTLWEKGDPAMNEDGTLKERPNATNQNWSYSAQMIVKYKGQELNRHLYVYGNLS